MIILIGGVSCTGKTLLSQKLLEKYHIPYLSIDHLKMGLFRGDPECGFTPLDSSDVIGEKLWPVIKGIIMTCIENNQNMIIEGCYLLPHLVRDFDAPYSDQVISLFLGFSTAYIEENFDSKIVGCRSAVEKRTLPEERPRSQFIEEHRVLREQCRLHDSAYFMIDSDYDQEIAAVYQYIDDRLTALRLKSGTL